MASGRPVRSGFPGPSQVGNVQYRDRRTVRPAQSTTSDSPGPSAVTSRRKASSPQTPPCARYASIATGSTRGGTSSGPAASKARTSEANKSPPLLGRARYSGLTPSRSRQSQAVPRAGSTRHQANIPRIRSTHPSPQAR